MRILRLMSSLQGTKLRLKTMNSVISKNFSYNENTTELPLSVYMLESEKHELPFPFWVKSGNSKLIKMKTMMRIFNSSLKSVRLHSSETWRITEHAVNKKYKCEMVRQCQQQHCMDQDKSAASWNRNTTKTIALDWSHAELNLAPTDKPWHGHIMLPASTRA